LNYLDDSHWHNLSTKQKLDLLQHIANIESTYLGLPVPVKVCLRNFNDGFRAGYNNVKHHIAINADLFDSLNSDEAVILVLHEIAHAYQRASVAAMELAIEYSSLKIFSDARNYIDGFNSYVYDDNYDLDNYEIYWSNIVEVAAREYSENYIRYFYLIYEVY